MLPRQRKSTCKAERYGQGPDQGPIRMQRCTARRPRLYLPASSEVSLLINCYQACFLDSENLPARPNDMARALIRILFACSAALHEDCNVVTVQRPCNIRGTGK